MNPGRFYIPGGMSLWPGMVGNMARNAPLTRMASSVPINGITASVPRGMGLFRRITNGIRSVNWGGLLNNANKTLNVVNQTIPLVRQAGPMFNNMKSMVRIAKAFGNETNSRRINNNPNRNMIIDESVSNRTSISNNNNNINISNIIDINENIDLQKKEVVSDNAPNFFV